MSGLRPVSDYDKAQVLEVSVFATYLVQPGRWALFKALFHGKPMSVPGSRVSGVIPWGVSRTRVETWGAGGGGGYDGPVPLEERMREVRTSGGAGPSSDIRITGGGGGTSGGAATPGLPPAPGTGGGGSSRHPITQDWVPPSSRLTDPPAPVVRRESYTVGGPGGGTAAWNEANPDDIRPAGLQPAAYGGHTHSDIRPCTRVCPQYLRQSGNVLPQPGGWSGMTGFRSCCPTRPGQGHSSWCETGE
jgi:hypothetical protein